jgi:hypothetical protein
LRVLNPSLKSLVDYQLFPASRLQRRNDSLFDPPALFAAFDFSPQLHSRLELCVASVRPQNILVSSSIHYHHNSLLPPQPIRHNNIFHSTILTALSNLLRPLHLFAHVSGRVSLVPDAVDRPYLQEANN